MKEKYIRLPWILLVLLLMLVSQRLSAQQCPTETPAVVISEIHYNPPNSPDPGDWVELYNPTAASIDLSAYQLQDQSNSYVIPNGTMLAAGAYLVLARNTFSFAAVYPGVSNYIGPLPFGLSGSGEMVKLLTDSGCTLDSVTYDDQYPWPVAADGNGPSLELINPLIDNSLATSWVASPVTNGTPGAPNAGAFDPCDPTPASIIITEISYNSPPPIDAGDWVEIYNPNSGAVDLSNWKLSDGSDIFNFPLGTTIGAYQYWVIVKDSAAFMAQHPSVSNFIGNMNFGLSKSGDQVILSSATACVVDGVIYEDGGDWPSIPDGNGPTLALTNIYLNNDLASSWGSEWNLGGSPGASNTIRPDPCWPTSPPNLLISEINYQSDTLNANAGDWVEIHNPTANPVDVSYYQLKDESGAGFFLPAGTVIPAGGYYVMVADSGLFTAQHPSVSNFAGQLGFSLSNSGQRLRLFTPNYCQVDDLTYDDLPPWPLAPNGMGFTLSLANNVQSNDSLSDWAASQNIGGTPGQANLLAADCPPSVAGIIINEIFYKSSPLFDPGDWIEIHNPTNTSIDLSQWVIMEETSGFRLPSGLILAPGEYWVIVEDSALFSTQYPTVNNFIGPMGFTLKGSGEHIFLLNSDFCIQDELEYKASAPWPLGPAGNGPSLSLIEPTRDNSLASSWLPSAHTGGTPGAANTISDPCDPQPSPIVINEIHYNSDPSFDPGNWVELYNPSNSSVDVSGWELHTDSASYVIPNNTSIAANSYLILAENTFLFSFQFWGVNPFIGPIGFGLDNAGEKLLLYNKTYCLVDSVKFNDKSPWPILGDGEGPSISLRDPALDNALGINWVASPGNGTPGKKNIPDPCFPARIDAGLSLWLKADAGTSTTIDGAGVNNWTDQSGADGDFSQGNSSRQPTYYASPAGFNGNPALYFDDIDDGMLGSLEINNPYTLFIVYNLESFPQGDARAVEGSSDWYIGPNQQRHTMVAGSVVGSGDPIVNNDNRAVVAVASNSGFFSQFYLDGVDQTAGFASDAPAVISLGASGSSGLPLGGYIAELIVYDRQLNIGERRDIETYLATKYGIQIDPLQHRFVEESNYNQDIIGLGRDSLQCFLQTSSKSNEKDAVLTISIDPDSLGEEDFIYVGHDHWGMSEDTDPLNLPAGIVARNRRIWQVRAYGDPASFNLQFELDNYTLENLNEFVVLRDGGNNFDNSQIIAKDYYIDGSSIIFENVPLKDGDNFSLARREVVSVDISLWLEGPFDPMQQLMGDALRTLNLLPRQEPFTALGNFTILGEWEGDSLSNAVLNISGAAAIVDWIWVELRDANDSTQTLAARPALIRRDGKIVDLDGKSALSFPELSSGNYFLVVRHRNHLGVMSATAQNLDNTASLIDFSTLATYGTDALKDLGNGQKGLWTGDVNGDGQIVFQGGNNDATQIFIKVLSDPANSSFARNYVVSAYDNADLNMDGQIIFQGGQTDISEIFISVLTHPGNTSFSRAFVLLQQLP
ncbi:MAG: lamin tail domain-containing protein [Bacteroidota bacterium]